MVEITGSFSTLITTCDGGWTTLVVEATGCRTGGSDFISGTVVCATATVLVLSGTNGGRGSSWVIDEGELGSLGTEVRDTFADCEFARWRPRLTGGGRA